MHDVPENGSHIALLTGQPVGEHCVALCNDYNIWNAMALYEKFSDYGKLWFFGADKNNTEAVNFYINNIPLLKKFAAYFENQIEDIIKKCDKKSFIPSKIKICRNSLEVEKTNKKLLDQMYKKSCASGDVHFSKRETECVNYLLHGKSAKEIARILGLSPRTVESYIVNVKKKTGTTRKSQIVNFFEELDVLHDGEGFQIAGTTGGSLDNFSLWSK